jgi:hypothetical protein
VPLTIAGPFVLVAAEKRGERKFIVLDIVPFVENICFWKSV